MTHTRRGSAYVLVLIVSAIAATIVVAGLSIRKDAADRGEGIDRLASARLLAKSGIEAVLQWGDENSHWRADGDPSQTFNYTIGAGAVTVDVTDPSDGDLTDDENDPYRLVSTATLGDSRAVLRVDVSRRPSTDYRDRVLASNPVAFWPLDESTGSPKAQNLAGTTQGAYASTSIPGAFTGSDNRPAPWTQSNGEGAAIAHHNALLIDEGTIMCWVYNDATHTKDQTIIAKDSPGNDGDGHFRLYLKKNTNDLIARLENDSKTKQINSPSFDTKTWTHIAVTFGTGGFSLYLDGTLVGKKNNMTTGLGPAAGGTGNTLPLLISTWTDGLNATDVLLGSVRDVVVFDKALTETEIDTLITDPDPSAFSIDPDSWAWLTD